MKKLSKNYINFHWMIRRIKICEMVCMMNIIYYRATLRLIREYPNEIIKQSHLTYVRKEYRKNTKVGNGNEQEAYIGYLIALDSLLKQRRCYKINQQTKQLKQLPSYLRHIEM